MTLLHKLRALFERLRHPSYGCCYRCRRPWACVPHHTTRYSRTRGCFPLCETCWAELESPEARLPYYRSLWTRWVDQGADDKRGEWPDIETAVRRGL